MGVWLRRICKEYAVVCNGCERMETVRTVDMECAIGHFRNHCGWKLGKVDLCPECQRKVEE